MVKFQSSKVFDGFSTVFRQWRAVNTHCSKLHGYAVSFKIYFEGDLDERNWVFDFGGMKRAKCLIDGMSPKVWMDYMFDHTHIVAEDDPYLEEFLKLNSAGVSQVRVVPRTGAESFAEFIFNKMDPFVKEETGGRVRVSKVTFTENGKNEASYQKIV